MKRNLLYLAVAGLAGGGALWILATAHAPGAAEPPPLPGVYTIAAATLDGEPVASATGRPFLLRHDGPELVGAACPDLVACRRWRDGPADFRWSLTPAATLDAEALLGSAMVVRESISTTTTEGGCRKRQDVVELDRTAEAVRLRRRIAQTALVEDCETAELTEAVTLELVLAGE